MTFRTDMTRDKAFSRLQRVRDEFDAARFAVEHVRKAVKSGEGLLKEKTSVRPSHLRACSENLDMTYVLRLFAEFEATLRDYIAIARPTRRPRRTQMNALMDRVGAICGIPFGIVDEAHEVRDYRNDAVHDRVARQTLTLAECKARISKFLSFLPVLW
jgi:hypothetical protein